MPTSQTKQRYAIVGTGERAMLYVDAIEHVYGDSCELVGLCDSCQTRMDWHNDRITSIPGSKSLPTFLDGDFDQMIKTTQPDVVIVTTVDSTHHRFIIRAMQLGCDVITEKPMTTDAGKVRAILECIDQTQRKLRVTFNYRYHSVSSKIHEVIRSGAIGRPQHINFNWMLDTSHGADYFRRWHRDKTQSGGLLVHKSSHHFDLVNWWLRDFPDQIGALGDLRFYGEQNAQNSHTDASYDRYTGEASASDDPFAIDLSQQEVFRGLYLNAEDECDYIRDRNVFGSGISSEDTLSVSVRYRRGTILTYSLVAYSPSEGCRISITGDKGRIDFEMEGRMGNSLVQCLDGSKEKPKIKVSPLFGDSYQIELDETSSKEADAALLNDLFSASPNSSVSQANHLDGAAAVLTGIAANESIESGNFIKVSELMNPARAVVVDY